MLFSVKSNNPKFNHNMSQWRKSGLGWWLFTLGWVLATPFMAMRLQHQIAPELANGWLASIAITNWPMTYGIMVLTVFLLVELISWLLIQDHSMDYPEHIDKAVGRLAQKAGIPVPRVIYIADTNFLNAGALRSFMYGSKVVLFGNITKLNKEQLEAIIAHEIAHLVMRDVWFSQFARAMLASVKMVNRLTLLALAISIFVPNHDLTWFLAGTFLVTWFGSLLARASYLKYSRICEYRADAIAVELTTPEHRQHLIDGLKLVREMSFIAYLKKKELAEIDSGTHPTNLNRAKALGAKYFLEPLGRLV